MVLDPLAKLVLSGKISDGATVQVEPAKGADADNGQLIFKSKN